MPHREPVRGAILADMGSGSSVEVFNARERIVTTDFNRMQRFESAALAQVLMRIYGGVPAGAGSVLAGIKRDPANSTYTATTSPVPHRILNGLIMRIDAPGYLTVDAGSALFYTPGYSSNIDDSDWIVVDDPGVTSTTTVEFVPNGGGSIRIDVLECNPVETITEQENRDIYDPGTGAFTPSLVNKVATGRLQYRLRTGTAGAGIPNNDSAWCPIGIIAVPVGATGFDDCTAYDVRPLLDPAVLVPGTEAFPSAPRTDAEIAGPAIDPRSHAHAYDDGTNVYAHGWFATGYKGYLVGGPIFDAAGNESVNLASSDNASANVPPVLGNARNALVCLLPPHFYRLVRYSAATSAHDEGGSGRVPVGPNGIFTTTTTCGDGAGLVDTVQPPALTGITQMCVGPVVTELRNNNTKLSGFVLSDRKVAFPLRDGAGSTDAVTNQTGTLHVADTTHIRYNFTLNPSSSAAWSTGVIPRDARYIIAEISVLVQYATTSAAAMKVSAYVGTDITGGTPPQPKNMMMVEGIPGGWMPTMSGESTNSGIFICRIPIIDLTTNFLYTYISVEGETITAGYGASTTATLRICGYER
jgi:hypothetical protein